MRPATPERPECELVVRLLGGVEFCGALGNTTFSGAKQRAVAARLALDAGRVVSAGELVDSVWGERSPPTVRASLQVHVSQIRRALAGIGLDGVVVTNPAGYLLDVPIDAVDIHRFERLAIDARTAHHGGHHAAALDLAGAALGLWRGAPLTATHSAPFVDAQVVRLEGRRLELMPVVVMASIAVGRQSEFLSLVETLAADHPYSEPLWQSLARLLYAEGRQTDALDRLATVRRVLLEELGLDPSPTTIELERQILNHDASLLPVGVPTRSTFAPPAGSKLPLLRQLSGRDELIDDVVGALGDGNIVTLAGPSGVGKTSVAVHAATAFGTNCRDGVCFVDLTTISAGQSPLPAVVGALGFRPTSEATALEELMGLLLTRQQLLVVDNCEHVIADAADLVVALGVCPGIRVLATSRERLGLTDEVVIDVPPLSTAVAAELFLRRAQASCSGFKRTDEDIESARRIATLVDGLPLGVELTSPLVRSMSPREIADALERGQLTARRQRGRDARHASMHDAVAWSYELLDDAAQTLFERFSVFEGGTDLTGITTVCSDNDDGPCSLHRSAVVEALDGLVARSLITAERTSSGMRYRMLQPVQAFARGALEQSGAAAVELRHVHHVIAELRAIARIIESSDPLHGVVTLERAAGNIRAAYHRCRSAGKNVLAAEIVGSISPLAYETSTAASEWAQWASEALSTVMHPATRLRVVLAVALRDEVPNVAELARAAIELASRLNDADALTLAHLALAQVQSDTDVESAISTCRAALELSADTTSPVFEAIAVTVLSSLLLFTQRHAEAAAILDSTIALGTQRYGAYEPIILAQTARIARLLGDHDRARTFLTAAEAAAHRTGTMAGLSDIRFGQAQLARSLDDLDAALPLLREALAIDLIALPNEVWRARSVLATVAVGLDRIDIAVEQLDALAPSQRPLQHAARAVAAGCVARLNGFPAVAIENFATAATTFASVPHSEALADVLEMWAPCLSDSVAAHTLVETATGLRSGATATSDAMRVVESLYTAP